MLIQDLGFFEQINNLDDIQGGTAEASSFAQGDIVYTQASTIGEDGVLNKVIVTNIDELDLIELFQEVDIALLLL